ncbi:hypothetical protein PM082_002663 [Marasmius tenuissimus]|nr:hypothetical protein PM082_002663 [Marasmius tenuissimus]
MIKLTGDEEQLLLQAQGSSSSLTAGEPITGEVEASTSTGVPEEPPPSFSLYDAEYFTDNSGNIVSHDPHLNSDGEALYRFLLSQSLSPPTIYIHCKATHQETRTRTVSSRHSDGRTHHHTETYNETVTDFDFLLDISSLILPLGGKEPIHWSSKDPEPSYRGRMFREIEGHTGKRRAIRAEKKLYAKWAKLRENAGIPPWVTESAESPYIDEHLASGALGSSKTVRQWADDYCASPRHLKQFTYRKVVYGWNMDFVLGRVHKTLTSAMGPFYGGNVQVFLEHHGNKIHIRPDNRLSRVLSNVWLKVLLWILLIYPFIWLFKRFHSRGGGRWEVCGGAYPITRYVPLESLQSPPNEYRGKQPDEPPPNYEDTAASSSGLGDARIKTTADGRQYVRQGVTEHTWFAKWERFIISAVRQGHQSSIPINGPRLT